MESGPATPICGPERGLTSRVLDQAAFPLTLSGPPAGRPAGGCACTRASRRPPRRRAALAGANGSQTTSAIMALQVDGGPPRRAARVVRTWCPGSSRHMRAPQGSVKRQGAQETTASTSRPRSSGIGAEPTSRRSARSGCRRTRSTWASVGNASATGAGSLTIATMSSAPTRRCSTSASPSSRSAVPGVQRASKSAQSSSWESRTRTTTLPAPQSQGRRLVPGLTVRVEEIFGTAGTPTGPVTRRSTPPFRSRTVGQGSAPSGGRRAPQAQETP
jgi:hypothetical protein